jgi:1-deoxy-D-xylulose-5-phosphate reductoisomerase
MNERLAFNGIPAVIEQALSELPSAPVRAFESLYEADREAREVAATVVESLKIR